jgi:fructose-bisphosphate aldolase class I
VYDALYLNRVKLEESVLKPSMVISGKDCAQQAGVEEVAERTVKTLKRTVPAAVAGIVFLSGGQSDEVATAHLNAMNRMFAGRLPWPLSFSYGRALQAPSLKAWKGSASNVSAGQAALLHRSRMNSLASSGRYSDKEERQAKAA